LIIRDSLWF
jgi:hypothetical protein